MLESSAVQDTIQSYTISFYLLKPLPRSSDKSKSPRQRRSGEPGVTKEREATLKYVISEAEFKQQQQQKRKSESPKRHQHRGHHSEGQRPHKDRPRHHHHQSEGHQGQHGHRQSIRRQAQVASTAPLTGPGGGGDVSDAFDDDGLFQFEQGGGAAAPAAVAAPGEDRTDCKRQ